MSRHASIYASEWNEGLMHKFFSRAKELILVRFFVSQPPANPSHQRESLPSPLVSFMLYSEPLAAIGNVSFAYWGSALALAIAAELVALRRKNSAAGRLQNGPEGYRAGDLGLDPLGLADDEVSM